MRVKDFQGTKIYRLVPAKKGAEGEMDAKKLGRVHHPVFTAAGDRLVGFMVKRPDVAGMIKQADRFVALDAVDVVEGLLVVRESKDCYDAAAAKRLGISLPECIIWTGMGVVTESGKKMGYCADADVHPRTGRVKTFSLTQGSASSALLGTVDIPAEMLRGYRSGRMVVADAAAEQGYTGGAAAKAAEASVVAKAQVKKGAKALDEHGSVAVDKGSRALGKQLGRAKGMFGAFASEYKKASGAPSKPKKRG